MPSMTWFQVFNELMDAFRVSESVIERILATFIRVPALQIPPGEAEHQPACFGCGGSGAGRIVQGTYQSRSWCNGSEPSIRCGTWMSRSAGSDDIQRFLRPPDWSILDPRIRYPNSSRRQRGVRHITCI